ncbi:conserved hypothetical protein [Neospora caninum Liverpool]|uniref:Transmembrane protein n=1 Tax=Neospora caninum (strain Liverpool) TaxID=572307 RepID=F0VQJ0_NEOCL|nr:conserved hypothetical protein [Neospora caninum Liverpool]CBZ55987.1 conserved hypothetical protein [Neospora caninum Liverpool]CEL70733.1 TPA: hypothetical protein BN1204_064130 [Neospora caninum Liverpool]|eukprot:XP_003886013.1 conserved hypothetical protein [Neospora caninum Liverpool]
MLALAVSRPFLFSLVAVLSAAFTPFFPPSSVTWGPPRRVGHPDSLLFSAVGPSAAVVGAYAAQPVVDPLLFGAPHGAAVQTLGLEQAISSHAEPSVTSTMDLPDEEGAATVTLPRRPRGALYARPSMIDAVEQTEDLLESARGWRRQGGKLKGVSANAAALATAGSRKKVVFNITTKLSLFTHADGTVVCETGGVAAAAVAGEVRAISFSGSRGYVAQAYGRGLSLLGPATNAPILPLTRGSDKSVKAGSSLLVLCPRANQPAVAIPRNKAVSVQRPVLVRKAIEAKRRLRLQEQASRFERYGERARKVQRVAASALVVFLFGMVSSIHRLSLWLEAPETQKVVDTVYRALIEPAPVEVNSGAKLTTILSASGDEEQVAQVRAVLSKTDRRALASYERATAHLNSALSNSVGLVFSAAVLIAAKGATFVYTHRTARNRRRAWGRRKASQGQERDNEEAWIEANEVGPEELGEADIVIPEEEPAAR